MPIHIARPTTALLALAIAGTLVGTSAEAAGRPWGRPGGPPPHGWHHGGYRGYNDWFWIAGSGLLLYPYLAPQRPVIIEQHSDPVLVVPPQAAQNWYYCDSARAYYPHVQSCPEGWRAVPATPPAASVPAAAGAAQGQSAGQWYYCDAKAAYYPYVQECPSGWRATPATPADTATAQPGVQP